MNCQGSITPCTRFVDLTETLGQETNGLISPTNPKIPNPFCVPMAGFLLWIKNLHRWQLYQPDLVHHFIDVCLEGIDYQLGELPKSNNIFWLTASLLHQLYPSPELRLRIARRMMDIAGVAKEQEIVRSALVALCELEPACQCSDRHFLAEFVRISTSDAALFSPCFYRVADMADLVLADDLARLVAFRRHLSRAFFQPETLSEARHKLLELLAGWPASGCAKRFRLGQDGGLRWGTSSCWNVNAEINICHKGGIPPDCLPKTRWKKGRPRFVFAVRRCYVIRFCLLLKTQAAK